MKDYEFEVICGDDWVAGAASSNREEALREVQHYVAQYSEEGPCEIWEVTRTKVWPE